MVMTAAVFGIVLCAGLPLPTRAAYILKASPTCQADFPTATDLIVHEVNGVRTAPQSDTFQWITCSIPRSPNAVLAANGSFYVDGDNLNGASTTCWIASYSYTGDFLGMSSFTTTLAHYDYFLTLPAAQLGPWAYTSLTCALPARGNGLLRGVTTVQ
jgi:hypothetical protein